MRRFIQIVVFLWVAVSVCGCSGKKDGTDEAAVRVVIGGSISGGDGRMLYLHHLAVDTTGVGGADYIGLSNNAVVDGKFILSCQRQRRADLLPRRLLRPEQHRHPRP